MPMPVDALIGTQAQRHEVLRGARRGRTSRERLVQWQAYDMTFDVSYFHGRLGLIDVGLTRGFAVSAIIPARNRRGEHIGKARQSRNPLSWYRVDDAISPR
jgi:hypothetical protein